MTNKRVLEFNALPENTRERVVASLPANHVDYWSEVQPILDRRCVVCHGCYDAQCQLKLSSIEGIERGASKDRVYDSTRLTEAPTGPDAPRAELAAEAARTTGSASIEVPLADRGLAVDVDRHSLASARGMKSVGELGHGGLTADQELLLGRRVKVIGSVGGLCRC